MKTFDEVVEHARGRLVTAKEIVAAYEPTHVNKRRPQPTPVTPANPVTPVKNPNGKAE